MAINTKTYISKSNTIIKDSYINSGLNPVLELNYGNMLTRGLIYFDHSKVKGLVDDFTYPDIKKLRHVLKMRNMASIDYRNINKKMMDSEYVGLKERASSFDLIFFLIPNDWDEGRGFDYAQDLYMKNHRAVKTDGSSWYNYKNYCKWEEDGIYSTETLSKELDKFTSKAGNQSKIIIGYQHFDYGNEMIEFDITETMNKFITGEIENYGIGIAFSPQYENTIKEHSQYVGFHTHHTHSFFEPYVETTYDDYIKDDRTNFILDRENRLYFYSIIGSEYKNLVQLPKCRINGTEYEVKQSTKGVYYVEFYASSEEFTENAMYYDEWYDIVYNGRNIKDVELSFVTKPSEEYFTFGLPQPNTNNEARVEAFLSGILYLEKIKRGDIRKIIVDCPIPYTTNQQEDVEDIQYRLFVMAGVDEIDVIEWSNVERMYDGNVFFINTNELIPTRYYVDIKIIHKSETIISHKVLQFDVVNDVTEVYV